MSSAVPDAKSTPSILNFFKRKSDGLPATQDKRIRCPACSALVEKTAINSHLDNDCGSKSSISGCNRSNSKYACVDIYILYSINA